MNWDRIRAWFKKASQTLFGPVGAVLVVVVAIVLVCLGVKNIQIGGILGALLGRNKPRSKALDAANSIPADRIGPDGKLIPIGQADSQGMTQVAVAPVIDTGLFGDPNVVVFNDPQTAQPVEVALPTGVKANDVEHVIVVQPGTFAVTVKNSSSVTPVDLDALLSKYKT